MLIDMDTRKLKLKEGDLLIFDGKTLKPIALDDITKPLQKEMKKLQSIYDKIEPLMNYVDKHKKIFGGPKKWN